MPAPAAARRRRCAQGGGSGSASGTFGHRGRDDVDDRHAIGQRVVHLQIGRKAIVLEPFDQVKLPERFREVELVTVESRDQRAPSSRSPPG